jgi:chitin deacetylase
MPGLIALQHELSDLSVGSFMNAYPLMKQNGWKPVSVVTSAGNATYQNVDAVGNITPMNIVDGQDPTLSAVLATIAKATTTAMANTSLASGTVMMTSTTTPASGKETQKSGTRRTGANAAAALALGALAIVLIA